MVTVPPMFNGTTAINSRFQKVRGRKDTTWWSHMRDCMRYCAPQRETFFQYTPGQKKMDQVFDSTAMQATTTFASRLQYALTPPGAEWAALTVGDENDAEEVVAYKGEEMPLEDAISKVNSLVFKYITDSNYYSRDAEANVDAAISTGCLTLEYDAALDELVFDSIPLSNIYVEPNATGGIGTVWREFTMPVSMISDKFPGATITDAMKVQITKNPQVEFQLLVGMSEDTKTGDWWQFVLTSAFSEGTTDSAGGPKGELIYSENYGPSSPYIVFRWMVVPGEYYGRGPAMQALPDILTINKMMEFMLRRGALDTGGIWTGVSDGIFNPFNLSMEPNSVIPVQSNRLDNPTLRALEVGGNYQIQLDMYDKLSENIKREFLAEEPFGDINDPTKTATEIRLREQAMLQRANANFGRLMVEKVRPLFERVVYLLGEEGIIPRFVLDGKQFDIKFTNSVARVQDFNDVQVMRDIVGSSMELLGPETTVQGIKVEDLPGWTIDKLGADPALKRTEQEKMELMEQAQQMAQDAEAQGVDVQ